jgi:hypothetical protein
MRDRACLEFLEEWTPELVVVAQHHCRTGRRRGRELEDAACEYDKVLEVGVL